MYQFGLDFLAVDWQNQLTHQSQGLLCAGFVFSFPCGLRKFLPLGGGHELLIAVDLRLARHWLVFILLRALRATCLIYLLVRKIGMQVRTALKVTETRLVLYT